MALSQNNVSLVLNQQDVNGVNVLNRVFSVPGYISGTAGQFTDGILPTTGSTSITLPTTNVLSLFVLNAGSTGDITVAWTPASATGSVIAGKLNPGGALMLWNSISGASGSISALSLTADLVNQPYQLFIGG